MPVLHDRKAFFARLLRLSCHVVMYIWLIVRLLVRIRNIRVVVDHKSFAALQC